MSRKETKKVEPQEELVEEVVPNETDEVDDYLNELAEEVIEQAETPKEPKAPKGNKKDKKPKAEGETTSRGPKVTDPNLVTPAILAEQLGTDPRSLRMFLRAKFPRTDSDKNHSWSWAKDSKELQEIRDAWAAKGTKTPKVEKTADPVVEEAVATEDEVVAE